MIPEQNGLIPIWKLTNKEKIVAITYHVNNIRRLISENTKLDTLIWKPKLPISEYTPDDIEKIIPNHILSRINYLSNSPSFEFKIDDTKYNNVHVGSYRGNSIKIDNPENIILYLIEKLRDNEWAFRLANISELSDLFQQEKRELKIKDILK